MSLHSTLLIGSDTPEVRQLERQLDGELFVVPTPAATSPDWQWSEPLQSWRDSEPPIGDRQRIVVALWQPRLAPGALLDSDLAAWLQRCEAPMAAWFAALGRAQQLCSDNGAIVAIVEAPAALDSADWGPETAIAEAVAALARSLARSEGPRGVRVNVVTTPWRTTTAHCVAPEPPLTTFPGRLSEEVAGAVRLLLSPDACGITGTVMHADCGRSW